MNRTSLRRLAAVAVAPVAALGLAVAPAQATPEEAVQTAGEWIAGQLADEPVQQNFGFPDYGLTIDAFLALHALDEQQAVQDSTIAALEPQVAGYVTGGEFGPDDRYAGAFGKLGYAVQLAGDDATDFGGFDLVAGAEERVQENGRATDLAGDFDEDGEPDDFSNGVGQAWVVRSLTAAGSELADETARFLLSQQCADGSFLVALDDAGCTTGSGDTDATVFALDALLDVQDAELLDVAGAIGDGVDFLLRTQSEEDGSFENADGNTNTNTTGKAGALFGRLGGLELEAARATQYVRQVQVDDDVAEGTELEDQVGTIAFDPDAFEEALESGLDANLDQWRRATYQAATALPFAAPAAEFTVTAPDEVEAGETFDVEIEGPAEGENGVLLLIPAEELRAFEDAAVESPETLADDPAVLSSVRFTGEGPGRVTALADLDPTTVEGAGEAPDEAGDYVLLAISEFFDRGGATEIAVTSADGGGAGGGDDGGQGGDSGGAPVGSGSGVVGATDPLPAAGSTTTPWLPWAAAGLVLVGAALAFVGRGRYQRA